MTFPRICKWLGVTRLLVMVMMLAYGWVSAQSPAILIWDDQDRDADRVELLSAQILEIIGNQSFITLSRKGETSLSRLSRRSSVRVKRETLLSSPSTTQERMRQSLRNIEQVSWGISLQPGTPIPTELTTTITALPKADTDSLVSQSLSSLLESLTTESTPVYVITNGSQLLELPATDDLYVLLVRTPDTDAHRAVWKARYPNAQFSSLTTQRLRRERSMLNIEVFDEEASDKNRLKAVTIKAKRDTLQTIPDERILKGSNIILDPTQHNVIYGSELRPTDLTLAQALRRNGINVVFNGRRRGSFTKGPSVIVDELPVDLDLFDFQAISHRIKSIRVNDFKTQVVITTDLSPSRYRKAETTVARKKQYKISDTYKGKLELSSRWASYGLDLDEDTDPEVVIADLMESDLSQSPLQQSAGLALWLAQRGYSEEADNVLRQLIAMDDGTVKETHSLFFTAMEMGSYTMATEVARTLLASDDIHQHRLYLALALYNEGKYAAAHNSLRNVPYLRDPAITGYYATLEQQRLAAKQKSSSTSSIHEELGHALKLGLYWDQPGAEFAYEIITASDRFVQPYVHTQKAIDDQIQAELERSIAAKQFLNRYPMADTYFIRIENLELNATLSFLHEVVRDNGLPTETRTYRTVILQPGESAMLERFKVL